MRRNALCGVAVKPFVQASNKHRSIGSSTLSPQYRWVIVACCFMFLFSNIGIASTSFSIFQPYIVTLPGVGDIGGSGVLMIRNIFSLVGMFFVVRLIDAFDIRRTVVFACLLNAVGFLVYGFADSMVLLVAGAVLTGLAYGIGGLISSTEVLRRWFTHDFGTAVGIASVGSGAAAVVLPPLTLPIIHNISLSAAFFAESAMALVLAVVVGALLRNRPATKPDYEATSGTSKSTGRKVDATHRDDIDLGNHTHRLLMVGMFTLGMVAFGGMAYQSINMTTEGFDGVFAGLMISVAAACLMVSKVAIGRAVDMFGTAKTTCIFSIVLVAGLFFGALMPLHNLYLAVLNAVLYGLGAALASVGISIWSVELSPASRRLANIKSFQMSYALGGVFFNMLPGLLKTLTGTYAISYAIMCVCIVVTTAIVLYAYARRRKLMA